MSSDESMDDFIVQSDSGSDFEAAPAPKKAKKSPAAKAPAKAKPKATSTKTAASNKLTASTASATAAKSKAGPSKTSTAPAKKRKVVHSDDSDEDDYGYGDDREVNGSSSTLENHNAVELESDVDDSDAGPAKKKAPAKKAASSATNKSASDTYQKLTQVEHVLKRPDTYIGSIESQTQPMWVYDAASSGIAYRNITFVPGLYKIFDEIIVNAADNKRNDATMDTMKIEITRETGTISCWNNGRGIPVEIHSKEKIWIPELIFGHLLSSSNYDDEQKKVTGGRNGYGAKLANIYSHEFTVETADAKNGKKYKQIWKNNMSNAGKPKITDNGKKEEWTKITFKPDFTRFGMPDGIDDDTEALLTKRVYDMAGTLAGVKVYLNGKKLAITNFRKYVEMYTNAVNEIAGKKAKGKKVEKKDDFPAASQATSREGSEAPPLIGANADGTLPAAAAAEKVPIVYEKVNDRWEVAFAPSDGQFSQVSFVNSIATTKGGTHIEYVSKQLVDAIIESISKKNKKHMSTIKAFAVKNQLWVFVNCLIENPSFDSQTKENMTLPSKKFGSKCNITETFMKKVLSSGVVDSILNWAQFKQDQLMKKTDGTKRSRMLGIAKLDDANKAGTKDARNCTLILTEGDSAKTFAISGLSVVGRDTYGVFPLRGKLLNVRDAAGKQLTENVEIGYLKKILGLQNGKAYTSVDSLRYGKLMVMTDQDHDGSHIKGLIINFLDHFFPGLLQIPGFLVEFITPIVKVTKGKKHFSFFTIPEYETWKLENDDGRGWHIKYYKGLGTSTAKDAKEYFSDLRRHMIKFAASTTEDRALVDMAFNKKKADDRKEWLRGFVPGTYLDHNTREIPIRDFINKELVLFSMADNIRSIPSVVDGFKPGQRKVLFGCFKRNLKSEAKVAQLVGYISEATAYHHGEQSLAGTIVGMAQHFVGNNNINPLMPNGQFGTRLQGGKDHASPRYIFTSLAPITRKIFRKEDDEVLNYLNDDGQSIEPFWYMPILPMVLVNGSDGIGTGWSSAIPNYNPADIVANLRRKMAGEPLEPMHPWFRGFKGPIEDLGAGRYNTNGIACMTSDDTIEIFELPIRTWTNSYVEQLLAWSQSSEKQPALVKEFTSQSTETSVHLIIVLTNEGKAQVKREGLDKVFRLSASVHITNMVAFDANGKIKKYNTPEEIISDFYDIRFTYYMKRKDHLVNMLTLAYERFANQARFIQMFIKGELKVSNRELGEIVRDLRRFKFRPFPKVQKAHVAADPDASMVISPEDDLEETDDESAAGDLHDYDYLLDMPIYSLTAARARKSMAQRDEKEHELKVLLGQTPKSMWVRDLDEFMVQWEALLVEDEANLTLSSGQARAKGKGKIGQMKGNTLESAFAKAAALKAATQASASPEAKPSKAKVTKSIGGGGPSKAKSTAARSSPARKAPSAAAAAPKKKKKLAYDSDFDEDSDEDEKLDITLYDDSDEEASVPNNDSDDYGGGRKIIDIDDSASDGGMSVDEDDDDSFVVPPPKKR